VADGATCSADSDCTNDDCKSNCCGTKGQTTGCTSCDIRGDCAVCSTGYKLVNSACDTDTSSDDATSEFKVLIEKKYTKQSSCASDAEDTDVVKSFLIGEIGICSKDGTAYVKFEQADRFDSKVTKTVYTDKTCETKQSSQIVLLDTCIDTGNAATEDKEYDVRKIHTFLDSPGKKILFKQYAADDTACGETMTYTQTYVDGFCERKANAAISIINGVTSTTHTLKSGTKWIRDTAAGKVKVFSGTSCNMDETNPDFELIADGKCHAFKSGSGTTTAYYIVSGKGVNFLDGAATLFTSFNLLLIVLFSFASIVF
jgi:hypothetical protein